MKNLIRIGLPVAIVLGLLACAPRENRGVVVSAATVSDRALVIYAAGDVAVNADGGWAQAVVGDYLEKGRTVKTGARSVCELQFGKRAAVRIEEKTEVNLEAIVLAAGGTNISVRTAAGTILCKVEKLAGGERFQVKTKTAVCGVKGTEFGVTVNSQNDTVLAVRQGKVAIRPAAYDLEKFGVDLKSGDPSTGVALAELDQADRVVAENQSATVTAAQEAAAEKTAAGIEAGIGAVNAVKEPTTADLEKFRAVIRRAQVELQRQVSATRPLTADEKTRLREIDELNKRLEALPVDQTAQRFRVSIAVKPEDAQIKLGDETVGFGRFQGLFEGGEKLEFTAAKSGFQSQSLSITVDMNMQPLYEVTLEKILAETEGAIVLSASGTVSTRDSTSDGRDRTIEVALGKQETLLPLGSFDLAAFPNGPVTLLSRSPYRLLLPLWGDTFMLQGEAIDKWSGDSKVMTKGEKGSYDNGSACMSGIYRHTDGILYGFYPGLDQEVYASEQTGPMIDYSRWYGRIGAAASDDGGLTWVKKGPVLESLKSESWSAYPGQTTRGLSDAAVVTDKNGRYLYLYYCENARDHSQVTINLARADIRSGAPLAGAWKKYYRGGFTEDGLKGRQTPVLDFTAMDQGDAVQPQVYYCRPLGRYVMFFVINFWKEYQEKPVFKNTGIYVSYSEDAVNWSTPYSLIKSFVVPIEGQEFAWYPSFIPDANNGADGWLVYGYSEKFGDKAKGLVPYYMAGRRISLAVK